MTAQYVPRWCSLRHAISADFRPKANRRSSRHDSRDSRIGEPPTFVTITQCAIEAIEAIEAIGIDLLSVLRTLGPHEKLTVDGSFLKARIGSLNR
jgi:hypothetical protein